MSAENLSTILQMKPDNWTKDSYTRKNYVTVLLDSRSAEYVEVRGCIRRLKSKGVMNTIEKIERIQHPFAYGRFVIRKEQLEDRNGSVEVVRKYYRVAKSVISEAIESNMDKRRTPFKSLSVSCEPVDNNNCIIITKCIQYEHCSNYSRDSDEYPEYIVYFSPRDELSL